MNFQPFSAIISGNLFHRVDKPDIQYMKTTSETAVLLHGFWENNQLQSRGRVVRFNADTCVVGINEGLLTLESVKIDPLDPRRKFWKASSQVTIGETREVKVNVFPGLFVYHGFGSGNYYSAGGEIFSEDASGAYERSKTEDIPFVHLDSSGWTSDPDLKHERARALQSFEEGKRASLAEPFSAAAETA